MRKALALAMVFAMGAFLGPVVYAALAAAWPTKTLAPVTPKEAEIGRLIEVYRTELESNRLFMSVRPPPNGKECGYDPQKLFPGGLSALAEARRDGAFNGYEGYYALNQWRNNLRGEGFIQAIYAKMAEDMSTFEAGFLRRCIQATILSGWCKEQVAAYADRVDRYGPESRNFQPGGGQEDRIVCLYSDGVAARKGLPLAPEFDQDVADKAR